MPVSKQKLVIILRGLPGAGKTWLSKAYLSHMSPDSVILSSDDFFVGADKVFKFDKDKIEEAHKANFEKFKKAIADSRELIIVDNTNIKKFHYWHYLDYAQSNNYLVTIMTIPHNDVDDRRLAERNIHGVSSFTIRGMRRSFEWEM
jgi:tRNA uridine 5-carbamoylmethylation protein Kti12